MSLWPNRYRDLQASYSWRLRYRLWQSKISGKPNDIVLREAVGAGGFEHMGAIEVGIVKRLGLQPQHFLIDVGCGAGRLAKPLSTYLTGRYSGFDLVHELVDYARKITNRPDWRFEVVKYIEIPEPDSCADMVCFFSVLTHLLHEQSFWYLQEAVRVLKPGGAIVFSFLDFREPSHWQVFLSTLKDEKTRKIKPQLNVFLSRDAIDTWADHLGVRIEGVYSASESIVPEGPLGQSVCILRKA